MKLGKRGETNITSYIQCYVCQKCLVISDMKDKKNKRIYCVWACFEIKIVVHPQCSHILHNPRILSDYLPSKKYEMVMKHFSPPEGAKLSYELLSNVDDTVPFSNFF